MEPEIEVTERMVFAGLRELEAGRDASDDYSLVRDIYIAMAKARRLDEASGKAG